MFDFFLDVVTLPAKIGIDIASEVANGFYSDQYTNKCVYSEYSDGAMIANIKEKEAQLKEQKRALARLRQTVTRSIEEAVADLKDDYAPFIPDMPSAYTPNEDTLKSLSDQAVRRVEQKLKDEISQDEKELQQLDSLLQKINSMRLK